MAVKSRAAWLLVPAALACATPSRADEGYETSCVTSADCGSLHCIEGVCRTVAEAEGTGPTLGHVATFGTGRGYGVMIAAVDALVAVSEVPITLAATSRISLDSTPGTTLGVVAFAFPALPSSITHFAHGRVVPGIISFFAWPSLAGTTFVIAALALSA